MAALLLTVVMGLVGAFVSYTSSVRKATNAFSARSAARQAAQAGITKAVWCMNQSSGTNCGGTYGFNYAGESGVAVGSSAYYTTTIATLNNSLKTVTATGYFPSVAHPTATLTLKADVNINTEQASFFYGVQSGQGGFILGNNANVQGNIYANGSVLGSNGAYVTGDVYVAGGTALSPDQSQTTYNADYTFGQISPNLDIAQSFKLSSSNAVNKISLYIRKVSTPSNVGVYILADNGGVPSKTVIGSTTLNASLVTGSYGWVDASFSSPPALVGGQTYWLMVDTTASSSKYWQIGSQTNNGYGNGFGMVSANWGASTPVWSDAGRDYEFEVWTGGVTTKIDGTHVKGDAHANTLSNDTVDKDAYYQTLTATTVAGTKHPGSTDPGPQDFPISDGMIAQWKSEAAAGGTTTGDVTYDGTSGNLGPKKITGNLTVTNGATLTIAGTLYVQGDLNLSNNAIIQLASGYGPNSGEIVVDGRVNISNNVIFYGSGTSGSYVLLLTTNTSNDSANPAMSLSNNSANSIFYAPYGMINVSNNATLKEVTAFTLNLSNNSSVQYESGLASVNFSSGPGASWQLLTGTTRESK